MYPCECGGEYQKKCGSLEIQEPFVGRMKLEGVNYEECEQSKERIFPYFSFLTYRITIVILMPDLNC